MASEVETRSRRVTIRKKLLSEELRGERKQ